MIYADNIIEKNKLILRNLNTNALNSATDTWSGALTGYPFYYVYYETPTSLNRIYYCRCVFKFTTTSATPTWFGFYVAAGYQSDAKISNIQANTEYTVSCLSRLQAGLSRQVTYGSLYAGPSGNLTGVSCYAKNVLVYDVTELYSILKAKGAVTSDATFKAWCDNNLAHKPRYTNYDVSSLIADSTRKVVINKGDIVAGEFIETDGMEVYSVNDDIRNNTYFDSGSGVNVYNNKNNGTVTHTRVTDTTSPFYPEHKYVLKIVTNGEATPGAGGIVRLQQTSANAIFLQKIVAKIPVGYTLTTASNSIGTGSSIQILGSAAGTGKYEEYTVLIKCGASGSFSTCGHLYINGSNNQSVTWYVAYFNQCNITGKEYLKAYTALPKKDTVGANRIFSRNFNCVNLFPNGNCAVQDAAFLPSGWSYDASDIAGNAKASIVQPVNAGEGVLTPYVRINPYTQYKISFWVKCKADMTSFLTAISYYTSAGREILHNDVMYVKGTKTKLTAALNSGNTTVTVASNANWATHAYSRLGFRSTDQNSWHDKGSFNNNGSTGIVDGVTGTTVINLKNAYTGSTIASGTWIVEGYSGSNRPYPLLKADLPTNNTWKYVEYYIGRANYIWDGNDTYGQWGGIPLDAVSLQLRLNIYQNTGTVPIKYADIKIEAVDGTGTYRNEDKIQIGG